MTLAKTTFGWTASSRLALLDTSASSRRNAILNSKVPSRCAGQGSSTIVPAARTTRYLHELEVPVPKSSTESRALPAWETVLIRAGRQGWVQGVPGNPMT